eukprot:GHVQ01025287.1.p1 GENE.GHVQ01025287.1~~GHVQ01025287.1.p1  ORF type:complete len:996 (+),score=135.59 GHVQ01025287.1:514-3501(+)
MPTNSPSSSSCSHSAAPHLPSLTQSSPLSPTNRLTGTTTHCFPLPPSSSLPRLPSPASPIVLGEFIKLQVDVCAYELVTALDGDKHVQYTLRVSYYASTSTRPTVAPSQRRAHITGKRLGGVDGNLESGRHPVGRWEDRRRPANDWREDGHGEGGEEGREEHKMDSRNEEDDKCVWEWQQRYSDFASLLRYLERRYVRLPEFPAKTLLRMFGDDHMSARAAELSSFVQEISKRRDIMSDRHVQEFFRVRVNFEKFGINPKSEGPTISLQKLSQSIPASLSTATTTASASYLSSSNLTVSSPPSVSVGLERELSAPCFPTGSIVPLPFSCRPPSPSPSVVEELSGFQGRGDSLCGGGVSYDPVRVATVEEVNFGITHFVYNQRQGILVTGSCDTSVTSRIDSYITNIRLPWEAETDPMPVSRITFWKASKHPHKFEAQWFQNLSSKLSALCYTSEFPHIFAAIGHGDILGIPLTPRGSISSHGRLTLPTHNGTVTSIEYFAREHWLFSAGRDRKLKVYDTSRGRTLSETETAYAVTSMKLDEKRHRLFVGWDVGSLCIYDVCAMPPRLIIVLGGTVGGGPLGSLAAGVPATSRGVVYSHTLAITSMDFDFENGILFTGSADRTVCIWNVQLLLSQTKQAKLLGRVEVAPKAITSVCWCPCSRYLLCGCKGGSVVAVDATKGLVVYTFDTHTPSDVTHLQWIDNSRRLFTSGKDKTVKVWDFPCAVVTDCGCDSPRGVSITNSKSLLWKDSEPSNSQTPSSNLPDTPKNTVLHVLSKDEYPLLPPSTQSLSTPWSSSSSLPAPPDSLRRRSSVEGTMFPSHRAAENNLDQWASDGSCSTGMNSVLRVASFLTAGRVRPGGYGSNGGFCGTDVGRTELNVGSQRGEITCVSNHEPETTARSSVVLGDWRRGADTKGEKTDASVVGPRPISFSNDDSDGMAEGCIHHGDGKMIDQFTNSEKAAACAGASDGTRAGKSEEASGGSVDPLMGVLAPRKPTS